MRRRVCENCMKDYEIERNEGTPFPSFTVLGGIVGGVAGLITGAVVLVPATLLAGVAIDIVRCEECGSRKNVYEVMIEEDDGWESKIYKTIPVPLDENTNQYRYDELERRLTQIEDIEDSMETPETNMPAPKYSDYDVSFDVSDASLQVDSFGPETGGAGNGASTSGSGEGGDSGGSSSGGGPGGGE